MLMVERGLSKNTLDAYERDLHEFAEFAPDLLEVDAAVVRKFMAGLSKQGKATKTQARKISTLRQFFEFLFVEKLRPDNPMLGIEAPKPRKALPKYLNQDEVLQLLKAAEGNLRLNVMLEILYACGLRVSELISLRKNQARSQDGEVYLFVQGKGKKERIIPLGKFAQTALAAYLASAELNDFLFPAAKNGGGAHITRQGFYALLKQLAIEAGLDPAKVSPHVLRHSFASHMLENGADLRLIQELLGHENITTTEIYTHIQEQKLHEVVKKFHPLNN